MMSFKSIILMVFLPLCAWMCGCGEEDDFVEPVEQTDKIVVLIVDDATNMFEGGNIYNYNEQYNTFNLTVENLPAQDAGFIKVNFVEGNQLIYYATQIFNGNGTIIIPNPIYDSSHFPPVLTNDYVSLPTTSIELTNGPSDLTEVETKWSAIQNLETVRWGLQNTTSEVYYFKQNLDGGFTDNSKWIFILKY